MLLAAALHWLAATPISAHLLMTTIERQYPAQSIKALPTTDVAIVLGGAVQPPVAPRTAANLARSADHVLHAARLHRAGKVKRVLVRGGNVPWLPASRPEADLIRDLLIEWGVPAGAISVAGESRNTYENALEIKVMWRAAPFTSALLVTSAAHMPRAMAIFRRSGLPVIAATTDVEAVEAIPASVLRFLPDAEALFLTTSALKEWMGYWAYRARVHLDRPSYYLFCKDYLDTPTVRL